MSNPRQRLGMRRSIGVLLIAGPFVAGAIAAVGARHDARIAVMAAVATAVVWLMPRGARRSVSTALLAFALASLGASAVAAVAGARSPFGVIAVAVVVAERR